MPKDTRLLALKELQKNRKSKLIIYCLGDRVPGQIFSTKIALDAIPYFEKILISEGKQKKISLFLYSTGGNIDTPWPLVNLIREFCDIFEVIVPRKALSAATLISLGADKIVMGPFSQISPVDPEGNFLSPDGKVQQIAIEDIIGFIEFSKNKIGLTGNEGHIEILKALSDKVEPKILGNINRTHSLIRKLAQGMLDLHTSKKLTKQQAKKVVENLTQKAYSHKHFIGRREARETIGLGRMIEDANGNTYDLMEKLFNEINKDLDLDNTLLIEDEIETAKVKGEQSFTIDSTRAILQSESICIEGKSAITVYVNGQVRNPFKWASI
ncbi:MAG: hypothetical protein HYV29_11970 [Ignavibacteriales bacterium]|nr:hypothetical protein [Ignavibacteriales bacterium]